MLEGIKQFIAEYQELQGMVCYALDDSYSGEVEKFILGSILKIWGSHDYYTPAYAEYLKAITGKEYTSSQIVTAMHCCTEPERKLKIPQFIVDMVSADNDNSTENTADFASALNHFLVSAAFVNGDFTIEESNAVSAILDDISYYCLQFDIDISMVSYSNREKVTPTKRFSENNQIEEPVVETKKAEKVKTEEDDDGEIKVTLTLDLGSIIGSSDDDEASVEMTDDIEESALKVEEPAEPASDETLESLLDELNELVGLESVKRDVISLINFIRVCKKREQRGMIVPVVSYHLVFTGNPGTGKTTIARLVSKIYYQLGILPKGQLVETDRSALVAGYLGQTAIKTQKVIQSALGGVLFIDEAYSLANDEQDYYGKEAIETLLKAMEDHRNELVVIVAGYTDLMHKFIDSNPGLRSRFNKYFEFPDYTGEELLEIFKVFCKKNGYTVSQEALEMLSDKFSKLYESRDEHFGNARQVRNIFEKAINSQANRLSSVDDPDDNTLSELTSDDVIVALEV